MNLMPAACEVPEHVPGFDPRASIWRKWEYLGQKENPQFLESQHLEQKPAIPAG